MSSAQNPVFGPSVSTLNDVELFKIKLPILLIVACIVTCCFFICLVVACYFCCKRKSWRNAARPESDHFAPYDKKRLEDLPNRDF